MYNSTYLPSSNPLTSVLLGASATYTSPAMDTNINGESEIDVSALSSIGGSATNGFYVQSSNDGTNWVTIATQTVAANVVSIITISVYQRYWRVVYVNSTTAQTGTFSIIAQTDVGILPLIRPNTVHSGVSVPVYLVAGANAVGSVTVSNTANVNLSSASGAVFSIATNSTLAAATYSAVISMGYGNVNTLFFLATCATAGVVTIALSAEGTYYANHLVTITLPVGTTGIVLTIPPVKYVKLISTVALTAFTANVTTSY